MSHWLDTGACIILGCCIGWAVNSLARIAKALEEANKLGKKMLDAAEKIG